MCARQGAGPVRGLPIGFLTRPAKKLANCTLSSLADDATGVGVVAVTEASLRLSVRFASRSYVNGEN